MKNWSTDETAFSTPEAKERWELEQLINYGLGEQKLSRRALVRHFDTLSIDPARRLALGFFLHGDSYLDTKASA